MTGVKRVERFAEMSLAVLTTHESADAVEEVAVRLAPLVITQSGIRLSQSLSRTRCCTIGKGIFQFVSHGFLIEVTGNITVLAAQISAETISRRSRFNRLEGAFVVDALNFLYYGISHNGDGGVSHHTICFTTPKVPHGKFLLLVADVQHRIDEVTHALGSNN